MITGPTRVLFAWPRFSGSVLHAMVDNYADPKDHRVVIEIGDQVLDGHTGDPQPWLRHGQTLCGVRSGMHLLVVTPDEVFTPEGSVQRRHARVCLTCTRRWSAEFAPAMPGWTKTCDRCHEDLPVNRFRSDKRTRDGLASTCEGCKAAARATTRAAERLVARTAEALEYLAERRTRATRSRDALADWQASPWLPTFTCPNGHVLLPDIMDVERTVSRPSLVTARTDTKVDVDVAPLEEAVEPDIVVAWRCACGRAEVAPEITKLAEGIALNDPTRLRRADLPPVIPEPF